MFTSIKHWLLRERTLGRRAAARPAAPRRRNRQRGVALVAVMIAIAITLVISNDFGTTTNVDMMAAANYRDQMRSHFLARSAVSLSELVIRVQQRIDNVQQLRELGIRITDFADQVLLAFCGTTEEVQAVVGLAETKGLGAEIGTCGVVGQIGTEDDKINLNCANGTSILRDNTTSMLNALLYFPAYDPVFEEADAEGYRRDRATQVTSIMDYIDSDNARGSAAGASEDYGYETLKDRYKAKNNYLDTLGEVRQARGVDDRFWTLFHDSFTIYGNCKVNISAIKNVPLVAGILTLSAKNKNDPFLQNPTKVFALAAMMVEAMQFVAINKTSDFVTLAKDPVAMAVGVTLKNPTGDKLGLELNITDLNRIAGAGPRRTYRVEAWGEIQRKQLNADGSPVFPPIRTTVTGVWDTRVVPQSVRKPPVPKGAWVYQRED